MEPRQIFGFGVEHSPAIGAIAERFEVLSDARTICVVDAPSEASTAAP